MPREKKEFFKFQRTTRRQGGPEERERLEGVSVGFTDWVCCVKKENGGSAEERGGWEGVAGLLCLGDGK